MRHPWNRIEGTHSSQPHHQLHAEYSVSAISLLRREGPLQSAGLCQDLLETVIG
jgi:hypothetical protein